MKYLQQNLFNGEIEVSEAPIPKIEKNEVLIKSINTLISSGTERSLIEFGKSNILKKVKDNKERVGIIIDKIKNGTIGIKSIHDQMLQKIQAETQALKAQELQARRVSDALFQSGVRFTQSGINEGRLVTNSKGFVPNFSRKTDAIASAVELTSASYSKPNTKVIKSKQPGLGTYYRNSEESVTKIKGMKQQMLL